MAELREQARAAYERGRLRLAALWVLPVLALTVVAVWLGSSPTLEVALGVGAASAAVGMAWRGRDLGAAVGPGLMAGSIGFVAPLLGRGAGLVHLGCGATLECVLTCSIAGVIAGGLLAKLTRDQGVTALLGGLGLASLVAAQTCLGLGVAGGAIMLAATVATAPLFRLAIAR